MYLQIISDLHIDFMKDMIENWKDIVVPCAPYLCILGDICELTNDNLYSSFLSVLSPHWKEIIIVNGNHEFYGYKSKHNKEKLERKQRNILEKIHNVHLLENSYIDIDGFRIIGSVLWSLVPYNAVGDVEWYVNDYRCIYTKKRLINTQITNKWHEIAVDYIKKSIIESPLPVVVLTHHAPLMNGTVDPKYKLSNHGFATNLEHLMGDKVVLWAFGHTHWCCDFIHRGTRVYSNAKGYDYDEKYNPCQVIEV